MHVARNRRVLWGTWFVLAGLGVCAMLATVSASMLPTDRAVASLPHLKVDDLTNGSYRYSESMYGWYRESKLLLLRDYDGELFVYVVPVYKGKYLLPDIHWFRWGPFCESFGPEVVGGRLKRNGRIKCNDAWPAEMQSSEWEWTFSGSNLGGYTDDMLAPHYVVEGGYAVIGKRE